MEEAGKEIAKEIVKFAINKVDQYRRVEDEFERLERTAIRIDFLLKDAVERRCIEEDHVKHWLCELKSISFDANHLLDKYRTDLQLCKLNSSNTSSSHKRKFHEILSPEWNPVQRTRFVSEIDKIQKRLDDICKGKTSLSLSDQDGARRESASNSRRAPSFHRGPLHDPKRIVGRETEKDKIAQMLVSDLGSNVPVVPIFGAAGIGKTTLAQIVYEDKRINDYFNSKIWVCLTEQCDVRDAMKEILEKMTNQSCDLVSFGAIEERLRGYIETLDNNKFLLVIDNFCAEGYEFWEKLRVPLRGAGNGSKVLITARNEKVCRIMAALPCESLTGLNDNECWQLLQSLAFPSGITDEESHLVPIGEEIARSCHGSPMAAKTLGFFLNGSNKEEWSDVLHEMQVLKDDKNGVLTSLKISYQHFLPYHVKQCFAYCAIFPNGYKFERDQVIRYWIAEDLVQPEGRRRLEAVGKKYFDELVWSFFFEKIYTGNDECQSEKYRMPSLIHDLARLIAQYEFRGLVCGIPLKEAKTSHIRYASLLHQKASPKVEIKCVESYSNLRTLKLCDEFGECSVPMQPIPTEFFHRLTDIRVLDLGSSDLENLPDSIGKLIHLRYLGLSNTQIKTLPESVCDLFNLQTLDLRGCLGLESLPQNIRRLINMRHLDLHLKWEEITDSTRLVIPEGVCKLECLQTLPRFNVVSSNNGQSCNLNELKDLNLRGDLCLLNLENVPANHAKDEILEGKENIENLMLRWSVSTHNNQAQRLLSEQVIKSLKPHNSLKTLWIVNYPGTNFPNWVGDASFSCLKTIKMSNCNNFSLGKLRVLKNLCIDNVPEAFHMDMPVGFPSLECFTLSNMPHLEKISIGNEFPKLRKISVSGCPNLKEAVLHWDLRNKFHRGDCSNLRIVYTSRDQMSGSEDD